MTTEPSWPAPEAAPSAADPVLSEPALLGHALHVVPPVPDPSSFLAEFSALAEGAGFRAEELVATAAGPVTVWRRSGPGERVYLSAGIHGDEPAGPLAMLDLVREGAFADERDFTLCPLLNPTGFAASSRESDAGIDLNRDYLKLRSAEVRAHAAWLGQRPVPDLFLSLHEDWETSGFYFYEINLGADRPDRASAILAATAAWFAPEPERRIDDHLVREPGWIYHEAKADLPRHWPEAIFLAKRGCPLSFTFETPSRKALGDRVACHVAAVRAVLEAPLFKKD